MLIEMPYRKVPGVRQFLLEVRARTADGESIALAGPFERWDGGYDYFYARSLYLLAGRRVVPLLDPADRPLPQNIGLATAIASYRSSPRPPGWTVVWRGRDGELLRRAR